MTAYVAEVSERTRFRREPELSGTLPASYYFDPEIFEREKEEIWFKTWQFVGYRSTLCMKCKSTPLDLRAVRILLGEGGGEMV